MRQVVREEIWPLLKFLRGEGKPKKTNGLSTKQRTKRRRLTCAAFGSFDYPNVRDKESVPLKIVQLCKYSYLSEEKKALWWVAYRDIIKDTIQK